MVRDGTLAAGSRLPATRALAGDLGVSRRLVVDAYAQLLAEGYLGARRGAGTFVAAGAARARRRRRRGARAGALRYDFFPGSPDLAGVPAARLAARAARGRCARRPTARSATPIRAGRWSCGGRWPGTCAACVASSRTPSTVVVCAGAAQGTRAAARACSGATAIAVEDPGLPQHREILARAGASLLALPVDEDGARVEALGRDRRGGAVLVTPAHQSPTGVALSPRAGARRCSLGARARRRS